MDKIHDISTLPDLPFCFSSSKTTSSLYERGLKTTGTHTIQELTIITSTMLQATSNQF